MKIYSCAKFLFIIITANLNAEKLVEIGCYQEGSLYEVLNIDEALNSKSASECVSACENHRKRYAGIHDGENCICGSYHNGTISHSCDITCLSNQNETCGGKTAVSLYETSLGAPTDLKLVENFEDGLRISWKPPPIPIGLANLNEYTKQEYKVNARPLFYFSEQTQPTEKNYKFFNTVELKSPDAPHHPNQTIFLNDLHPGVKYRISVIKVSYKGDGYPAYLEAWTKVGKPNQPMIPEIMSRTSTSMIVYLEQVIPSGGPISYYHIIVVDETIPVHIDFNYLQDYYNASEQNLPYYIAAELIPETFSSSFTVGDKKFYGRYFNSELKPNKHYHILLGVISTINETKASYSESSHSQHEEYKESDHFHPESKFENELEISNSNAGLILGLSIAIGVFAFLLFASVIIYFALRIHFQRNARLSGDHQELAVHAHYPYQDFENGYAVGLNYVEEEEPSPDHYRLLRERVPIIPHQSINIVGDIGIGKFGDIKKGVSVSASSDQVNSLIHRIQDDSLNRNQKSEMLKDFDLHIKLGRHDNIVCLIGLLEELNIISIVFEYEILTLKSNLVESRAVQHYPVYAEKNRRFSTLQESQVLEFLVGVARGMKYLHSLNIAHGRLSARNVSLKDGIHPKVTGFGLLHFHNDLYIPDYRRWQAPEVFQGKVLSSYSSDVWSFGCLMWETVTLGGTPYSDIRSEELFSRITRGLRLSQPQYVSDELYQSMLLCWQNDSEERPFFEDLEVTLRRLATDDITPHLLFSLYPSFKYEAYSSHLEYED